MEEREGEDKRKLCLNELERKVEELEEAKER